VQTSLLLVCLMCRVRTAEGQGNVIFLTLKDGNNSILPVYIGEYECGALIKEMHKRSLVGCLFCICKCTKTM
jgi:hypothetical protein